MNLPAADVVDLWHVLTRPASREGLESLARTLSEDELVRHRSFLREADARTYLLAHGMLRAALSHYLGEPPEAWRFIQGAGGKPRLALSAAGSLEFNLSHCSGLAVCAFRAGPPLGVDVEPLARAARILSLEQDHFSFRERQAWPRNSREERARRAVWVWTAKEALLKASGQGLSVDVRSIRIEWRGDGTLGVDPAVEGLRGSWRLTRLCFGRDHLGALALPENAPAAAIRGYRLDVAAPRPGILATPCLEPEPGLVEVGNTAVG